MRRREFIAGLGGAAARPPEGHGVDRRPGFMTFAYSLSGKWLELLKQIAPSAGGYPS